MECQICGDFVCLDMNLSVVKVKIPRHTQFDLLYCPNRELTKLLPSNNLCLIPQEKEILWVKEVVFCC